MGAIPKLATQNVFVGQKSNLRLFEVIFHSCLLAGETFIANAKRKSSNSVRCCPGVGWT